ncbi:MAG: sodium:calcium antiporter [Syntrophothermus sp.]
MILDIIILIASLGFILLGATFFTNGIEWLGKRLNLSEGAVGSILAAVGTALPETLIPIIAILFSTGAESHEVGIGAILGAPFMLSTLAFFIVGLSAVLFRRRRQVSPAASASPVRETESDSIGFIQAADKAPALPYLSLDTSIMRRDLGFFLAVYTVALLTSLLPSGWIRPAIAVALVAAYLYYAAKTIKDGAEVGEHHLAPLYFAKRAENPALALILLQVLLAIAGIAGAANLFVNALSSLSAAFGVPALILSLFIAPVATELPEKFNSVIWIREGKDTLALGNITGAMVFQSSMIPALGIAFTPWALSPVAATSAVLAILSAGMVYLALRRTGRLRPVTLLLSGAFYVAFIFIATTGLV